MTNARVKVIKKKRDAQGAAGGGAREGRGAVGESAGGVRGGEGAKRRGGKGGAVSPARRAAFDILRRVEEEGAFAAPLLASAADELRAEDRALCHELVLGCLRRRLWLDRLAEQLSGREAASIDPPVRRALRLGLYQLRFLSRVPQSAAVNESVNITHGAGPRGAANFVNAVLRRATREPGRDPAEGIKAPLERIAVETSHPFWLIGRWAHAFGAAEAEAFARANNEPAPTAFRVNELLTGAGAVLTRLTEAGARLTPSRVAPGAWRFEAEKGGGAIKLLRALADEGLIYQQDEASQLIAHVVGAEPGERVLDACAAPGGKTTHMAALAGDRAFVVAGDTYEHRLRLVREASARHGLSGVRAVVHDVARELPFAEASFDRVLVDAPCTGTGTLRHNPEIRWRITHESVAELAGLQLRILSRSARAVCPGGRLVYSTCSVEPEENEHVIAAFLKRNSDFRRAALGSAGAAFATDSGAARTWPHRQGVDGFFVAALERLPAA